MEALKATLQTIAAHQKQQTSDMKILTSTIETITKSLGFLHNQRRNKASIVPVKRLQIKLEKLLENLAILPQINCNLEADNYPIDRQWNRVFTYARSEEYGYSAYSTWGY